MAEAFVPADGPPMSDDFARVNEQMAHRISAPISLVLSDSNGNIQVKIADPGPQLPVAPPTPQESALRRNREADQELGRVMHNGVDFSDPSVFLPEQAKQALQFFANNPTPFSVVVQDAGGKLKFGPFFVSNANENTYGYLHTAGFNSNQMERLSAALSLCCHDDYDEAAWDTFMCTVWQLITENVIPGTGGFLD